MLKVRFLCVAASALLLATAPAADAAILGPDAAQCARGDGPAVLVRITGLKNRAGSVRARTFAGDKPSTWFNKKQTLKRTQVSVPASGPVEICMPVPKPGGYVVDIRHDINGNGDSDRADGAGASGNPNISLFDFLIGKKPPASKVVFQVGEGVASVSILMKYVQGGSFKPVQVTAR
ncbi:MAG: hypothetical protein RL481_1682 [Pseudomonadota bacterium]|jgi:uncharacterized protein (DUF2141 family)